MILLMCISAEVGDNYFTAGKLYDLNQGSWAEYYVIDDEGDHHEFVLDEYDKWIPCGNSNAEFQKINFAVTPTADKNNIVSLDQQRVEEVTEWCRNKPEEAAVRILTLEEKTK